MVIFFQKNVCLCPTGYKYIDLGAGEQNLRGSISEVPVWPTPFIDQCYIIEIYTTKYISLWLYDQGKTWTI